MTFQHTIPLDDTGANETCNAFFRKTEKKLRSLDADTRLDILMELQSHLFETLKALGTPYSQERLEQAISSIDMGYIDDLRIMEAFGQSKGFYKLPAMATAFWSYLRVGGKWTALGAMGLFGYAFAIAFIISAILGLFQPDHVGYFKFADGSFKLGYVSTTEGAEQFYGRLYSPIAMALGVLMFFGLNKLLLRKRRIPPA